MSLGLLRSLISGWTGKKDGGGGGGGKRRDFAHGENSHMKGTGIGLVVSLSGVISLT